MTQERQWQLSGNASEQYQRNLVPYLFQPWAQVLVEQAELRPREQVLDVACGTGVVARLAAEKVGTAGGVIGLDLNPGMLDVARSLEIPLGCPDITWLECSAMDMKLPDESFDVVLCQQGLQFFPDRPTALQEMWRVLVSDGRLLLSVWKGPSVYYRALGDAVERHMGTDLAGKVRMTRIVPDGEEISRLVVQAGFQDVLVREISMVIQFPHPEIYVPMNLASSMVAGDFAALDEATRAALVSDVSNALDDHIDGDALVFPDVINIATAHK